MDLRLGPTPRKRILPFEEEGIPATIGQTMDHAMTQAIGRVKDQAKGQAPKAEAFAARWIERTRPAWSRLTGDWRRTGTIVAALLIVGLLLHATFGANGMVVYRQKRSEMQSLQSEVKRMQKENDQYVAQIKALKSDPAAIEKEAREQLHYTRRGEVVYVAPEAPPKPPIGRAKNEN